MTMATTTMSTAAAPAGDRPGRSLEELVDRIFEALFRPEPAATETPPPEGVARSVHEARRLRQAGDLDGALAVLAGVDPKRVTEREACWAYAEWLGVARRRFRDREAVVYSPGTGRAAVLAPHAGALEVLAVLGMRWELGKAVSRRSLRGLRPLVKGGS